MRAAIALAQLWREQRRSEEAYGLLAPIYGRFSQSLDTDDLKDAKALLSSLGVIGT